jgi:hypothetical protein
MASAGEPPVVMLHNAFLLVLGSLALCLVLSAAAGVGAVDMAG